MYRRYHKEREQSGDRRNVGEGSCNSGDGTGQMAQPLMFMMMMMRYHVKFPTSVAGQPGGILYLTVQPACQQLVH